LRHTLELHESICGCVFDGAPFPTDGMIGIKVSPDFSILKLDEGDFDVNDPAFGGKYA
jgi:hypothetical protein